MAASNVARHDARLAGFDDIPLWFAHDVLPGAFRREAVLFPENALEPHHAGEVHAGNRAFEGVEFTRALAAGLTAAGGAAR